MALYLRNILFVFCGLINAITVLECPKEKASLLGHSQLQARSSVKVHLTVSAGLLSHTNGRFESGFIQIFCKNILSPSFEPHIQPIMTSSISGPRHTVPLQEITIAVPHSFSSKLSTEFNRDWPCTKAFSMRHDGHESYSVEVLGR
jgi:hypothetical protein